MKRYSIFFAYTVSANIHAGTRDTGGTRAGADVVDIALERNAKKKSRSVIGKFMHKLFR